MRGQPVVRARSSIDQTAPRQRLHQLCIRSEVTALHLQLHQLLLGRVTCQQCKGCVQQFTHPWIEFAHPVVCIEQQDALADAGQRGLQQLGVFQQLGIECPQLFFGALALRNVGVRAYHAQRRADQVALHHRAAGQNPFPTAVLATHPKIDGVFGSTPFKISFGRALHHGQVVRVDQGLEITVTVDERPHRVAQHFFPLAGVGLCAGGQVPVPDPHARPFQGHFPGAFTCGG